MKLLLYTKVWMKTYALVFIPILIGQYIALLDILSKRRIYNKLLACRISRQLPSEQVLVLRLLVLISGLVGTVVIRLDFAVVLLDCDDE